MKKFDVYRLVALFIIFLSILSAIAAYVVDLHFVEHYTATLAKKIYGQTMAQHASTIIRTSLRLDIFREQMIILAVLFGVVGISLFGFKQHILSFLARHRKLWMGAVVIVLILFLLFIFGEIFLRLFFSHSIHAEVGHGPGLVKHTVMTQSQSNSFGYWDVEHAVEKKPGTFRVLVFGDSLTYGYGLWNLNESYPRVLQGLLDERYGPKHVEVIKLAVPGYSTADELLVLQDLGMKLQPDLIILGYHLNDAEGPWSRIGYEWFFYGQPIIPYEAGDILYKHSFMYYFLWSRIKNSLTNFGIGKNLEDYVKHLYSSDNPFYSQHIDDIATFLQVARDARLPVVVMSIPVAYRLDAYPFTFVDNFVSNITATNHAYYLDLLSSLKMHPTKDMRVSLMDGHFSTLGNMIIARTIFDYLEKQRLLPSQR